MRPSRRMLAEARAFNADFERRLAELAQVHEVGAEAVRRAHRSGRGLFPAPIHLPEARELTTGGGEGAVRLRVLPARGEPRGVYLHLHGGGWSLGGADLQDELLAELTRETGLVAVSVEYRLAPEHPYPAALDDCEAAALWLLEHGTRELGSPPLFAIGGESAGAHLAVLTLLRLRDRHGVTGAFAAANLVYGIYDLGGTPSTRLWGRRNLGLSGADIDYFVASFAPGRDVAALQRPELSPLYADLRDLPPALFTAGLLDPLLDDSLFLAARWRVAGNGSRLRVWPEAIHGFTAFPLALGRAALADQYAYLRLVAA